MSTTMDAVNQNDLVIPLIDFSKFLSGDAPSRRAIADQVTSGFKTAGFIYLQNHGIPPSAVAELFGTIKTFFARPQAEKDPLAWGLSSTSSSPGYTAYGGEKLSNSLDQAEVDALRASHPDMKEALDVGWERLLDDSVWPGENDGEMTKARLVMQSFTARCRELQLEVMKAIALGLGLEEGYFQEFLAEGDNTLRCLHYPPTKKEVFEKKGAVRAGAHSDYGAMTFLFQDSRGGLQVASPDGTFVDATPIPNTIIVNAGDMLARWANDTIKSSVHRVVEPPSDAEIDGDTYPARYSAAYFTGPNGDTVIDAIPGTYSTLEEKKYGEGVTAREWLMKRLVLGHDASVKVEG